MTGRQNRSLLVVLGVVLSLIACKKREPSCAPECVNGQCVDGVCKCWEGWGGLACNYKLAPFKGLYIDSVMMWRWPKNKPNGNPWDSWPFWDGDWEPEVFLEAILSSSGETIWSTSDTDATTDTVMLYPVSNSLLDRETASAKDIYFVLKDKDQGSPPDNMCSTQIYHLYPELTGEKGNLVGEVLCGDSTVLRLYFSYIW